MMLISNFTAIRKQKRRRRPFLDRFAHQCGDHTEAVREDWTNCPDPPRRGCLADFQDCQNSANADFLTILSLASPIESETSRRLRACIDLLKMLKIEKDSDGRRTLIRLIGR